MSGPFLYYIQMLGGPGGMDRGDLAPLALLTQPVVSCLPSNPEVRALKLEQIVNFPD